MEIKPHIPDYTKPLPESYNIGQQLEFKRDTKINEVGNAVGRRENISVAGTAFVNDTSCEPPKPVSVRVEYTDSVTSEYDIPYNTEQDADIPEIPEEIPDTERTYRYITPPTVAKPPKKEVFFRIIGEAFKEYIIAEVDSEIVVIDKHAAHERILFEKIKSGQQSLVCQMMLVPIDVMLSYEEFDALIHNKQTAEELGFSFREKRNTSVSVDGIPAMLDGCDPSDLVIELAEQQE